MFSYMLHSHIIGAAVQVDWYRDNKHIGIFAEDQAYDFNFQESRHFETNKRLMPVRLWKERVRYMHVTVQTLDKQILEVNLVKIYSS